MTIEDFENAASIVPFNIAETWMANASRQQGISIQINYMQKAIIFGAPTKVDMPEPFFFLVRTL
ncbi:crt [Symbiodinium pilosum]|uniref:Crt protein n=1 Tax=Symbiodinium pilosum TaxID=2952 RepID=A0A812NBN8_SYMPI|nr:crt [Symbiodinium pilosum]